MNNLDTAQNLADAGQHEHSMARSLIVIAAALKMQVEENGTSSVVEAYNQGYKDAVFDTAKDEELNKETYLPFLTEEEATKLHKDWCEDPTCSSSNNGMSSV